MKAIYLEFNFLKKRLELLTIVLIGVVVANIRNKIIYRTLNIDR